MRISTHVVFFLLVCALAYALGGFEVTAGGVTVVTIMGGISAMRILKKWLEK